MGCGGLVVRSRPRGRRFEVRNPILLKIRCLCEPSACQTRVVGQTSSRWCVMEDWERKLSSSSDSGSKLRDPSQNSPHVASKRGVNITNLYKFFHALETIYLHYSS
ncbi:hypothetical protein AVEN_209507-1 [Araneus ventricosus]|uniref:Uncharacterized protein n=1 Tax=Araneus ventricosus TaxID=182803 RepID=A0A4Y2IMW7_ARAVE|nr:hypothetical protein AVEN_209507-1 [Araneus ventricosus]